METLICVMPGLISGDTIYTGAFVMFLGGSLDRGNSFVQLIVHLPVYYGVSDVVAQVERANKEAIDGRLRNGIDLIGNNQHYITIVVRSDLLNTFCRASLVSICTIVSKASLA